MKYLPLVVLICTLLFSFAAQAEEAYAVAKVNLRAGPDGGYPVVDILKANERVELIGCVVGRQWCEVETRSGEHGWVYAHYLATRYQGNTVTIIQSGDSTLRIVTFEPNTYWNTYYRTKYFYPNRYNWIPRHGGHHHDHDDDDDHHGHGNDDDDDHGHHTPRPQKPAEPPLKYQKMKTPGDGKYNPLCPMGRNDC